MQVAFGNKELKPYEMISLTQAQKELFLNWRFQPGHYQAVAMYDLTAPSVENKSESPFLHYFVVNVPGMDLDKGDTLMPYMPPHPPSGSGFHWYVIDIYSQYGKVHDKISSQRVRNNPVLYAEKHDMVLLDRFMFRVHNTDPKGESTLNSGMTEKAQKQTWLSSGLTEKQEKWCRCHLQVAAKQPATCNREKAWFKTREGHMCYNPYAVCAKEIGTTTRDCDPHYIFENIPDPELRAYASLHKLPIPQPYDRQQMVETLNNYVKSKK